ncbi:MarR family transcriptional regulator [Halobacteriales archaeon SW_7_68_16]|nr:MAG: MarR family transcriptional regulator [Halobacteriales archaeon SW_7_68_16]
MSAEDDDPEAGLSDIQREGLALIRERGGVHQSDFWKALDVGSRKGSRILSTLEDAELVERERVTYEGNRTYYVTPIRRSEDLEFSLLMAGDMLSPFVGDEEIDPQSDAFSQWMMSLAREEQ